MTKSITHMLSAGVLDIDHAFCTCTMQTNAYTARINICVWWMGAVIEQTALSRPFLIKEHACSMYPAPPWSGSTQWGGSGVVRIYFQCIQAWARYISSIKCFHHMIIMMHKLCFHHIGVQLVPTSRAWEWAEMQHLSSFAKNRSSEAKLRNQWNISAIGCFDPFVCCVEEPAEAELEAARLGWC